MKRIFHLIAALAIPLMTAAYAEEPSHRDQTVISIQQICPVSGQKLGEHGKPVKVKIGEEVVFLCCKACAQGKIKPEHWATIHANFAKAQRICPVMKHELPANAKWTIVEGRVVFVCCPPCIEKINAEPQLYLKQLDDLYTASLKANRVVR
jgi:hypothetical protein